MAAKKKSLNGIRRFQENLRLTRPIVILSVGVLLPVLMSTSVGIVALALGEGTLDLLFGVLAVSLTSAAIGSGIVVTVLLGRRARTARLQTDLLGNVSHELKTPLAAIRMYGQTLQSGIVDQRPEYVRQCADVIVRETEWLGTLIDQLLTWRTAARDRDNLCFVNAPIADLAAEVAGRFERMIVPGSVKFQVAIDTSLPVPHDRGGISSIILNLLTNASKYSGHTKDIQLQVQDRDGQVEIVVKDNGIGIPEREIGKIFEPFHRVETHGQPPAAGMGLGLAIVKYMVDAHAGTISVESRVGQGSLFRVLLPASTEGVRQP